LINLYSAYDQATKDRYFFIKDLQLELVTIIDKFISMNKQFMSHLGCILERERLRTALKGNKETFLIKYGLTDV